MTAKREDDPFHCPTCGETFALTQSCPDCGQSEQWSPPLVLTKIGWRQPRMDGSTWMISPSRRGLVPVPAKVRPVGVLRTCDEGHRYRLAELVFCPACERSAQEAAKASATGLISRALTELPHPKKSKSVTWIVLGIVVLVTTLLMVLNSMTGVSQETPGNQADPTTTGRPTTTTQRTTTSFTFNSDFGWEVGACVDFVGDTSSLVTCSGSHDAEIIDVVSSELMCPASTEWYVELNAGVACIVET